MTAVTLITCLKELHSFTALLNLGLVPLPEIPDDRYAEINSSAGEVGRVAERLEPRCFGQRRPYIAKGRSLNLTSGRTEIQNCKPHGHETAAKARHLLNCWDATGTWLRLYCNARVSMNKQGCSNPGICRFQSH